MLAAGIGGMLAGEYSVARASVPLCEGSDDCPVVLPVVYMSCGGVFPPLCAEGSAAMRKVPHDEVVGARAQRAPRVESVQVIVSGGVAPPQPSLDLSDECFPATLTQ